MDPSPSNAMTAESNKRPRSSSGDIPAPPSKKTPQSTHLQINYLARQYNENIPLVNIDDTLPAILRLIGDYDGVLHRHESIAGNLGACPLGPILIRRFERLFDGPPRILKSHGKDTTVTWLDVVEFARNKPEQFNLEKMRNGVRVCQFYTKQSRVEISEEDYVLIASGMPQKLIPPQPIMEDEEKELGALEILEKNLSQIVQLADQVSARARQLNHRLKNRKTAIISRRETEAETQMFHIRSQSSPLPPEATNGLAFMSNGNVTTSQSPPTGFTAVNNLRQSMPAETITEMPTEPPPSATQLMFSGANTDNVTIINGTSIKGASPTTRAELLKVFFGSPDRDATLEEDTRRSSIAAARPSPSTRAKPRSESIDGNGIYQHNNGPSAVAIPSTPVSLLPQLKPTQAERDDGGPYKAEMVNRMESLHRGERILPPCDRCRRLHMDCLKNLTACQGCTKKHAKCAWKDVREEELRDGRILHDHSSTERTQADMDLDNADSGLDDTQSSRHTPMDGIAQEESLLKSAAPPSVQVRMQEPSKVPMPRVGVPAMIIGHQLQEAANGRAQRPNAYVLPQLRESIEQDDDDDDHGDRLQALAAQVYRTASQNSGMK